MKIDFAFITGFMVGLEFINDEFFGNMLIIDVGIIRIAFNFGE